MAASDVEIAGEALNNLKINGDSPSSETNATATTVKEQWGFPSAELYRIALAFYKEKEGKAMHFTYKDKLKMVAYTKQVAYGSYRADVSPDVGFLDVVGSDRSSDPSEWVAWQSLGAMAREDAMMGFVTRLDALCPLFKPYVAAHRTERDEQERRRLEEEERLHREEEDKQRQEQEQNVKQQYHHDLQKQQLHEQQIRAALNQQTTIQFKQYAKEQCPNNVDQQEALILQLQEQHYQQYMQQVYQQQLIHQQQQFKLLNAMKNTPDGQPPPVVNTLTQEQQDSMTIHYQSEDSTASTVVPQNGDATLPDTPHNSTVSLPSSQESAALPTDTTSYNGIPLPQVPADGTPIPVIPPGSQDEEQDGENERSLIAKLPPLMPASMWTRKEIKTFKEQWRERPGNVIKIGSLATATVRVPTHENGTCLFWEFATDYYDLAFGVYFEWTVSPSSEVSVQMCDTSDDEGEDEEGGGSENGSAAAQKNDPEMGGRVKSEKEANRPPTDEIIPVYRRDCHGEVYCGSHMYPGRGVYLLKFDNSYSLWRSKTLYYRVYYTR